MHNVRKSQISCNTSLVFHTSQIITFRNLYASYWAWAPPGIFWQSFICCLSGQPEYPATSPHTLDQWCSRSTPHSCVLLVTLACDQCVASIASPPPPAVRLVFYDCMPAQPMCWFNSHSLLEQKKSKILLQHSLKLQHKVETDRVWWNIGFYFKLRNNLSTVRRSSANSSKLTSGMPLCQLTRCG